MLFVRKTDVKQLGNTLFPREPPLSTNPPISEQYFLTPPSLSKFQKRETPPNFRGGGGGNYVTLGLISVSEIRLAIAVVVEP